jgi:hypothetical protein
MYDAACPAGVTEGLCTMIITDDENSNKVNLINQ